MHHIVELEAEVRHLVIMVVLVAAEIDVVQVVELYQLERKALLAGVHCER